MQPSRCLVCIDCNTGYAPNTSGTGATSCNRAMGAGERHGQVARTNPLRSARGFSCMAESQLARPASRRRKARRPAKVRCPPILLHVKSEMHLSLSSERAFQIFTAATSVPGQHLLARRFLAGLSGVYQPRRQQLLQRRCVDVPLQGRLLQWRHHGRQHPLHQYVQWAGLFHAWATARMDLTRDRRGCTVTRRAVVS